MKVDFRETQLHCYILEINLKLKPLSSLHLVSLYRRLHNAISSSPRTWVSSRWELSAASLVALVSPFLFPPRTAAFLYFSLLEYYCFSPSVGTDRFSINNNSNSNNYYLNIPIVHMLRATSFTLYSGATVILTLATH